MEEKIWFIFKLGDKHHQGPYSQKEVQGMLRQGRLPKNAIIWKEGMKRWKPLHDCPEFYTFSPPPPKQDTRKASPQPKASSPEPTMKQAAEAEEVYQESYMIRILLGLAVSLGITLLIWPGHLLKNHAVIPRSLGPGQKAYLKEMTTLPFNKKALFRLAINENRNLLWLSGNYKDEGKVFLTLISNTKKTLSLNAIKITSQSSFRHGYARFSHFTLVEGDWPVAGEYRAEVHLYPNDQKQHTIIWKGQFLLPAKGNLSLSESLENWKKNIHAWYITPLKNQYQFYQTFRTQLISMEEFYTKFFQSSSWREFSTRFEKYYNQEIGPLLQAFILDGRQLHLSLFNRDIQSSKEYEKLFQYGKMVGSLASDMATLNEQNSSKKFLPRIKSLIERADSSLQELQKEIDYYQKQLSKR